MNKYDVEMKINELSQAVSQMTADLNMALGHLKAYQEMLAKIIGNESNANEIDEAESVYPCEQAEDS